MIGTSAGPTILVFDSGLGGLTVFDALVALRPDAGYVYVADDAGFPYGNWDEAALVTHVVSVMAGLIVTHRPDVVVVACNTASTLVLAPLRARWPDLPFVGTVPAIKPAAAASRSRLVTVLGTPGTVTRDYTRKLIADHAADCEVMLVGSTKLAAIAEADMRGEVVDERAIAVEIAPCFVSSADRRTDAIALACTHYPLLLPRFERLAPWPVAWVDPAPAIARQANSILLADFPVNSTIGGADFVFTSGVRPDPGLAARLVRHGPPRVAEAVVGFQINVAETKKALANKRGRG